MATMNPYRVLGVEPQATGGDIRRAFHALALRFHPDAAAGESGERFVEISEAYRLLSDEEARSDYDRAHESYSQRRRAAGFAAPMTLAALVDLGEELRGSAVEAEELVRRGFVHEGRRRRAREALHYDLVLSPAEAARGGRFRFAIPLRRRGSRLVEECALEAVVPPGARDGMRAELPLADLGLEGSFVEVTVRVR